MRKRYSGLRLTSLLFVLLFLPIAFTSCLQNGSTSPPANKATSELTMQISLRKNQIKSPTQERLAQMQTLGMQAQVLNVQRVFIYLFQPLTPSQESELKALGITPYLDSWVPPAGNNSTGYLLADLPVDRLADLEGKPYVVSLDTAERMSQPQSDVK